MRKLKSNDLGGSGSIKVMKEILNKHTFRELINSKHIRANNMDEIKNVPGGVKEFDDTCKTDGCL